MIDSLRSLTYLYFLQKLYLVRCVIYYGFMELSQSYGSGNFVVPNYADIDKLIDNTLRHDSSRYDVESLYELYRIAKQRYGM